jgi:hypothetical protein
MAGSFDEVRGVAFADPKWLEILKASGGQSAAAAFACGALLLIAHWGWLPPLDTWVVVAASFGLLLFGSLAFVAFVTALHKAFPIREWIIHYVNEARFNKAVRNYIPHMTPKEREIIGYLLANNQKQFTADQDGGYATSLISRKIILYAYQPGQVFRGTDVPMRIPDNVWEILKERQSEFPYNPPKLRPGEVEPPPWRIHWMAR